MNDVLIAYQKELRQRIKKLQWRMKDRLEGGDIDSRHYLAGQKLAYEFVIERIGKMLEEDKKNGGKRK